jgi:peptidoglycan/LPS O-acetylase OafA/YrhL
VLATLAFLLGDWNWPVVGVIGIPLALGVGWLFFRYVERPLHRVARNAKRASVKLVERSTKAGRA